MLARCQTVATCMQKQNDTQVELASLQACRSSRDGQPMNDNLLFRKLHHTLFVLVHRCVVLLDDAFLGDCCSLLRYTEDRVRGHKAVVVGGHHGNVVISGRWRRCLKVKT